MKKSYFNIITGIAGCISFVAVVRLIIVLVAWLQSHERYWATGLARQMYMQDLWITLIVTALSIIVAIGIYNLGEIADGSIEFLSRKTIELEKKLEAQQEEINDLKRNISTNKWKINVTQQEIEKLTEATTS